MLIFQVVNARGKCRWHVVDARFGNVAGGNVEWGGGELSSRVVWPRTGSPSYTGRQPVRRVHTRLSRSRVNSVADGSWIREARFADCCDSFEALEMMEDDIFGGREEEGVKLNELFPLFEDFCLFSRSFGRWAEKYGKLFCK